MKALSLVVLGIHTLVASSLFAQQSHETIEDTDSFLQTEDVQNSRAFSWFSLTENFWNRSRPGGVFVDTNFYLIGGELDRNVHGVSRAKTAEIFDGTTGTWSTSMVEMTVGVSNIMGSVAAVGDRIYVFGGYSGLPEHVDKIQVYDISADQWGVHTTLMPEALYGCLALNVGGGKIFVCGGTTANGATNSAYVFDAFTGTITPASPMPTARGLVTGDNTANTVYVAGGYGTGTTLEAYDLATDTWSTLPSIPNDRAGCGVMAVAQYVVFYGGDWTLFRNDVDVYDSLNNSYDPGIAAALGTMPVGKRAFAYGDYQVPGVRALVGFDGWASAFLSDCTALF
ncbi:MAG: hypothetical protein HQ519_18105 [Planctomycetes bacterium]|nr:hypothetical protein [Planctomycetota bacterium]